MARACSNCHRARRGVHTGQAASPSQGHRTEKESESHHSQYRNTKYPIRLVVIRRNQHGGREIEKHQLTIRFELIVD